MLKKSKSINRRERIRQLAERKDRKGLNARVLALRTLLLLCALCG